MPGSDRRYVWDPADYDFPNANLPGMSPKKTHEVLCMSKYASTLLSQVSGCGNVVIPSFLGDIMSHFVTVTDGEKWDK